MPKGKTHYRLRLADAIEAHDTALLRGGRIGTISLASVESAIGRPYSGYYRSIHRKGAALIESICGNHGFTDGNKRTAVILLALLLDRSGYRLHPLESEDIDEAIANMTVSVADGRMSFDSIEMWLKNRVKKKPAR